MLSGKQIADAVEGCLIKAGTTFRKDQMEAYRKAIGKEKQKNAKWALETILENARIAKKNSFPLCDDTGIPHVFIKMGEDVVLPKGWLSAVHRGIAQGLRAMPGRPMAVKGDPIERVEQSRGLFNDPARLTPAPVILQPVPGDKMKITVLLLGGGPEIRAKTYRVFHERSMDKVLREVSGWASSEMKILGCTPSTLAIGIGRSHMEASSLMIQAMAEGRLDRQTPWEKKVTEMMNQTNVGPLGLGGTTTALGAYIKIGSLRASGVRIICMRPCCCFEPRRATISLT